MAEKKMIEPLQRFLSCFVCSETFTDPVSLRCHHSFCSACLTKYWEQADNKNCPVCKRRSSKDVLDVNFALKELADSYAGRQPAGRSEEEGEGEREVVCGKHTEEPRWFCDEEQRVVCHVCEVTHPSSHKVIPIEQAVADLKGRLKSHLKTLRDTKDKHEEVQDSYHEVSQHSKKQLLATERQIRVEFEKLHKFLREEEEARLAALREEEEEKGKKILKEMKMMEQKLSSLSDVISSVEQDLEKDRISFLTSYKHTQTSVRAQCTLPDPQLVSGALIDVAKHLGNLSFRVWEKMKKRVKFTPVILDPNTACNNLSLSDDLTSVKNCGTIHKLPDNPERNTCCVEVLGSEGFSSGDHSWEVEVGHHPKWDIGVVNESADRKRERSTDKGLWIILRRINWYSDGEGKEIPLTSRPRRIRVQLDYDRGEVSFYDTEDMSHIYTHRNTFTEKLYPYFAVIEGDEINNPDIRICQSQVSITTILHD